MEELEQEGASSGGYESDDDDDDEQQQWQQQQQQQQTSASSAEAVAAATAGTMSALEQQQQWQQQQREQPSAAENAGAAGPAPAGAASSCNGQAGSDEYEGGTRNLRELADLDFETGKLSDHERELLSSCRQLMETAVAVLKALGRALLQGGPGLEALQDSSKVVRRIGLHASRRLVNTSCRQVREQPASNVIDT